MPARSGLPKIRRLRQPDTDALIALRREALENHPLAFGASIDDDRGLSVEFVRAALADAGEQAVFGHFEGAELRGMVGVIRESRVKRRHRGVVWGMYVAPPARGAGVGRALLAAAVAHGRTWTGVDQLHLSVTDDALAARHLYETAGFRLWGREPRALEWQGRFADEFHLVLELGDVPAARSSGVGPCESA